MSPWFTGYVGTKAGFVNNTTSKITPQAQVFGGGHLEFDNYMYLKADAGVGTGVQANAEFGKPFELNNNMSVRTSVGIDYFQSFVKRDYEETLDDATVQNHSWKPNNIKGYGTIEVVHTTRKTELGLGLQYGINHSALPKSINLDKKSENRAYLAPVFNARAEVANNVHLQLKASTEYGSFGVLYTF